MKRLLPALALALALFGAGAAQAAASHADQAQLSSDTTFQNRVKTALAASCVSIANEGYAIANHKKRADYCALALSAPDTYKLLFGVTVATDTTVIADATAGGTVVLTSGNVATQQALVTDAHIDAAIAAEFNAFLNLP